MLKKVLSSAATMLMMATGALAQDGARAYHLLPQGTDIFSLPTVLMHLTREFDPDDYVQDSTTGVSVVTPTYRHSIDVGGNAGALLIGLPIGNLSTTLGTMDGTIDLSSDVALGDMFVSGVLGIVGSPSLAPIDYAQYKPGFRVSAMGRLYLPTGQYDSSRPLNMGSNRWSLHASLPISYVLGESMIDPELTTFEIMPSVHVFGDNTDPGGDASVTGQAPVFAVEGHITRNFGSQVWASLDGNYEFGGETSADGVGNGDAEKSLSIGATLGLSLTPTLALRLSYGEVVYSSVPDSKSRRIEITSAHLF